MDQRHGAAVAFADLEPGAGQRMARDRALHHLQHRREEFGLRGQQQSQGDRQLQNPIAHRHMRE
jgi:hypothetical protein